jgi:hypothetical protein
MSLSLSLTTFVKHGIGAATLPHLDSLPPFFWSIAYPAFPTRCRPHGSPLLRRRQCAARTLDCVEHSRARRAILSTLTYNVKCFIGATTATRKPAHAFTVEESRYHSQPNADFGKLCREQSSE